MLHPVAVAISAASDKTVCVMMQRLPWKHQSKLIMILKKLYSRLHLFSLSRSHVLQGGLAEALERQRCLVCFCIILYLTFGLLCWSMSPQWCRDKNTLICYVLRQITERWKSLLPLSKLKVADGCQDTPSLAESLHLSSPFVRVLSWATCAW